MRELKETFHRVAIAGLAFAGSLVLSAALVVSGIILEYLTSLALGKETTGQNVVELVLDVSLISCAVVVAVCGATIVVVESVRSTRRYIESEGRN